MFSSEAGDMTDSQKVDLLTEKLSYPDYTKFALTILPRTKVDIPFEDAVTELKRIFGRKESQFALRYKCIKTSIESGEDLDTYAARVNLRCEKFNITGCTADDFKVLVFVQGLNIADYSRALEELLNKLDELEKKRELADDPASVPALKLQDVVNIASWLGSLKTEKSMVLAPAVPEIMVVQKVAWNEKQRANQAMSSRDSPGKPPRPCSFCGGGHYHRDCAFRTLECHTCHAVGHKAGFCKQAADEKSGRRFKRPTRNRSCDQVLINTAASTRKYVEPSIDDTKLKLQLDSGSDWTIISEANYRKLGAPKLAPAEEKAISASGNPVEILGKFRCRITLHNRTNEGECYVSSRRLNVLGSDWMEALGLWSVPIASVCNSVTATTPELVVEIQNKFPTLFKTELGLCNKLRASLTLKPGTKPIFRRARPVPFAATTAIEAELNRLHVMNVISPIEYSEYAAPIVVVKKGDGRIRICADYSTGLNDALEPNMYPLPTPEDINSKLAHFKIFSKIDLSDAFLQIELDDEAKKLMPINTHCGLFQVNRLQPGVKTAPGLFQQLVETMMCGSPGTFAYIDDFIIGGRSKEEHRNNLFEALSRINRYGFKLRIDKCSFEQQSLTFLGVRIGKDGSRPDPAKISTLQSIPAPTSVLQLQSFLGAVTWYGKFVDSMNKLRGPLDELLCKGVDFVWLPKHQHAFESLKKVLASDLALTHYDPTKPIIVAADASSYGMGAVIMHRMNDGNELPILHAASSFTSAEKNYPQVQREALALVFALKKFHRYIYGRKFELRTDHKPLLSIFGSKEGIPVFTASRLQRYALILLAYDFNIKYIDTKSFAYADFISRLIKSHELPEEDVVIATTVARSVANVKKGKNAPQVNVKKQPHAPEVNVKKFKDALLDSNGNINDVVIATIRHDDTSQCFAIDNAKGLPITFSDIQQATRDNEALQAVQKYCETGWPRTTKTLQREVAAFFVHRKYITISEGCLVLGHRIIVPDRFRKYILEELHQGHPGIAKMKLLARSKIYWPGLDKDIENMVRSCGSCAVNAKSPIKCSLRTWPRPKTPWSRLHIDFAGPVGTFFYLVIVDAFSNWPEVFKMTTTTTAKTVDRIEETFARHGLADTIVSDNGPQFASEDFSTFCRANGIEHIRTAPYHPQSNGRAERFVDLLKTGLKKLSGANGNVDHALRKFLLCYRYTPSYALGGKSPFQVMTTRTMKTKLDLLQAPAHNTNVRNRVAERQFDNHHGAKWKDFVVGDEVFIKLYQQNKWTWVPGTVTERLGAVNYSVLTQHNREVKMHANQMKKRFNFVDDTNDGEELLEEFGLEMPTAVDGDGAIEPLENTTADEVELEQPDEGNSIIEIEDDLEDEVFADARDGLQEELVAQPSAEVQLAPSRRPVRSTAGQLPRNFAGFDMN